jgi:hypothetical protein
MRADDQDAGRGGVSNLSNRFTNCSTYGMSTEMALMLTFDHPARGTRIPFPVVVVERI